MSGSATVKPPPPAVAGLPAVESGPSLRALALRGSVWIGLAYGGGQVIRLGSNLILTRLLFPEAFGMMALVMAVLQGLQMFSDIGIGPSIVQNRRGADRAFLNAAWTVQIIRGFALWAIAALLAAPLSMAYGEPQLALLIPAAGLTAIIAGFNSTSLFTSVRRVALGRLTALELLSHTFGIMVMIAWALFWPSVWALVGGALAGSTMKALLSHWWLASHPHVPSLERDALGALIHFGKWIFLSTLLTYLATQTDRLIFGALVGWEMLGVYWIALMWAMLPTEATLVLGDRVVFPAYSRLHREGRPLASAFRRVRLPLLTLGGAVTAALLAVGPILIDGLYDARYVQAGWMLQILVAGAWFRMLECTSGAALLAMGHARWVAAGNLAKLLVMMVLIPIGFIQWGFLGAVAALAISEVARYAVSATVAASHRLPVFPGDLGLITWWAASVAALLWIGAALNQWGAEPWLGLVLLAAAAFVLWTPLMLRARHCFGAFVTEAAP